MDTQKKQRGDRRDGRRVRGLDGMHVFMPYMMPNRCDAEVYINETVDVTNLLEYIKQKNSGDTDYKMTVFHAVVAAMSKTILQRPYLNRFIVGRRYYERDYVTASFIARKHFQDQGEESLMVLKADGDTTLDYVGKQIYGEVKEIRESGGNELDTTLDFLKKMPRPILKLFMLSLRVLDYYDIMPRFLTEMDPNHTTVLLSNLGSIKCGAPYHHLNNFGTSSLLVCIGEVHKARIVTQEETEEIRDVMEVGITLDERIGDGFYFAKSVKLFKYFMENPALLEAPFKESVAYDN